MNKDRLAAARIPRCQQGAALVIALLILTLLSLIGITALQTTALQEKMAGNLRDEHLAFQAAEAALRAGEAYLQNLPYPVPPGAPPGVDLNPEGLYWPPYPCALQRWEQANIWTSAGSRAYAGTLAYIKQPSDDRYLQAPRYIIENLSYYYENCSDACVCTPKKSEARPSGDSSLKHKALDNYGGSFRVTARGVGSTTDAVVILQSYYTR